VLLGQRRGHLRSHRLLLPPTLPPTLALLQTRVLTARIVQLIHVHKAQPWQILAITFTNKVGGQLVAWRHPHSWYRVSFR
jgi:hypothetical protein